MSGIWTVFGSVVGLQLRARIYKSGITKKLHSVFLICGHLVYTIPNQKKTETRRPASADRIARAANFKRDLEAT